MESGCWWGLARRGVEVGVDRTADSLTGDIFSGSFLSGIRTELCVTQQPWLKSWTELSWGRCNYALIKCYIISRMPKTAKKCITHVAQTDGKPNQREKDREREGVRGAPLLWTCTQMCRRRGHKKQFSERAAAAITITCFVINYSLRSAGDRRKTTAATTTMRTKNSHSESVREAGRLAWPGLGWQEAALSCCWPCATATAAAELLGQSQVEENQKQQQEDKKRVHLIWRTNVSHKMLQPPSSAPSPLPRFTEARQLLGSLGRCFCSLK